MADTETRYEFEVYQDKAGKYRWRLVAGNDEIVADSGQGYASKQGAENGIQLVKDNAPDAPIV